MLENLDQVLHLIRQLALTCLYLWILLNNVLRYDDTGCTVGRGDFHMKGAGMPVGKFELNPSGKAIWG